MSWGFYCDLEVTLPTQDFDRIWKSKTTDHALPTPLIGFRSKELEKTFTWDSDHDEDDQPAVALKDVEKYVKWHKGRSTRTAAGGETTFRGTMLLDRGGDPSHARVAAAVLHASRATGRGHLLLLNDGSYSGESGVLLRLEGGAITRTLLSDSRSLAERLFGALYPNEAVAIGMPEGDLPTATELGALVAGKKAAPKKAAPKKNSPTKTRAK